MIVFCNITLFFLLEARCQGDAILTLRQPSRLLNGNDGRCLAPGGIFCSGTTTCARLIII